MKDALVIVDLWDRGWCHVAQTRLDKVALRTATAVRRARRAGVPVFFAAEKVNPEEYPGGVEALKCPPCAPALWVRSQLVNFAATVDACEHSEPKCVPHQAWTRPHPALDMEGVLVVNSTEMLYSNCKNLGVTRLLYCGGALDQCMLMGEGGILSMHPYFDIVVLPELVFCVLECRRKEILSILTDIKVKLAWLDFRLVEVQPELGMTLT